MTRRPWAIVALLVVLPSGCSERQVSDNRSAIDDDQAVLELVLHDFATWKEAEFGRPEGKLALDPFSADLSNADAMRVRELARNIYADATYDLVYALIARNKSSVPLAPIVAGSPWARIYEPPAEFDPTADLPEWAKAAGTLTLPGYSVDRSKAMVQFHHSWSIHSAVMTYVLEKQDGTWRILARDQAVFL